MVDWRERRRYRIIEGKAEKSISLKKVFLFLWKDAFSTISYSNKIAACLIECLILGDMH